METMRDQLLKKLHDNTDLWTRVKIYHRDLKTFSSNVAACTRLSNTHQPLCMSECYFSDDERQFLLGFPTLLSVSEGVLDGICTSHDLAPIIENAFGLRKGYELNPEFRRAFKQFQKRTK